MEFYWKCLWKWNFCEGNNYKKQPDSKKNAAINEWNERTLALAATAVAALGPALHMNEWPSCINRNGADTPTDTNTFTHIQTMAQTVAGAGTTRRGVHSPHLWRLPEAHPPQLWLFKYSLAFFFLIFCWLRVGPWDMFVVACLLPS